MQPEFEDETPIDPFDFWKGANFKLKAKNVAGYRNYDSSEFASPGPLLNDDEELEAIWKTQHSLSDFVSPDKFKGYNELKQRLNQVLNVKVSQRIDEEVEDEDDYRGSTSELPQDLKQQLNSLKPSKSVSYDDEEDDETLSYFQKLAEN